MTQKPKILLILPNLPSIRNVFISDFLKELKKYFQISIACSLAENLHIKQACKDQEIDLYPLGEVLNNQEKSFWFYRLNFLLNWMGRKKLASSAQVETLLANEQREKQDSPLLYRVRLLLWHLFFRNSRIFNLLKNYVQGFFNKKYAIHLMENVRPDRIVVFDIFAPQHQHFLPVISESDIPSTGQIRSWDNLSAKGYLHYRFDTYLVWNKYMEEELINYYNISRDKIGIVGGLNFDLLCNLSRVYAKQEFRYKKEIEGKRLISFMLSYPDLKPTYLDYVGILTEEIENGNLPPDIVILVRVQPGKRSEGIEEKLRPFGDKIIIDKRENELFTSSFDEWEKDQLHYAKVLINSSVVVNFTSTTTIDAALFDRPNVTIGFDEGPVKNYYYSMQRFLDRTHNRWVRDYAGNRIAKSRGELIDMINFYLENPEEDFEGRKNIVKHLCYDLGGDAARASAGFLGNPVKAKVMLNHE